MVAPGAAAPADDGDERARRPAALGGVGEAVRQPPLGVRQEHHALGADADGALPDAGVVEVDPDEHHARAARQPEPRAVVSDVRAEQHQRRRSTRPACRPCVGGDLHLGAGRRRQPQQVVEHVRVGGHDERPLRPRRPHDRVGDRVDGGHADLLATGAVEHGAGGQRPAGGTGCHGARAAVWTGVNRCGHGPCACGHPLTGACGQDADDPRRGGGGGRRWRSGPGGGWSRTGQGAAASSRLPVAVPGRPTTETGSERGVALSSGPVTARRAAAFFDLDKTVIAKSSTLAFSRPFYRGGLVNRRAVLKSSFAQFVYLLQGADEDSMDRMRDYLKALCTGWSVEQVNAIVAETLHELIDPMVYAEAVALFDRHHADGLDVVIVSSSGEEVVGPIGEMLGVDHVVATRMVVEDGRYTGEIAFYAYGEGKARGRSASSPSSAATTWRSAGPTATPAPTGRCSRRSATRWPSTPTRRCAATPRSRAGGCASSAGRCGCAAAACRRCPSPPGRPPRTGSRWRPTAAGLAWWAASPEGVTGVTPGPCASPQSGVQRTHGPPPAGGRRSPRRRSVHGDQEPTCDQPREARREDLPGPPTDDSTP